MLNAPAPCLLRFRVGEVQYFGDYWSPWSICLSQSHRDHPEAPLNQDREISSILAKSRSVVCLWVWFSTVRPEIGKNLIHTRIFMQTSRRPTEPKPGNRRIFTEIIEIHRIWTSYESGSDRSPRNRQNIHAHVFCKAPRCSFSISVRNDEKSSTKATKVHTPVTLEPPTWP